MDKKELINRFTYHPPQPPQVSQYAQIRNIAREFAGLIVNLTPECREQDIAIQKIEEAVMWANAAIARRS